MIKVKKSPGKRGIQWKLQLGSLYDVSLVGGKLYLAICNLWLEHSDFQSKSPASAFSIKVGM